MKPTPAESISTEQRSKIFDFLDSHPVGVLATAGQDSEPDASTIYFSVDKALTVTFTTKRDTTKHQNITAKNSVMLVVYDAETQSAVQLKGKAVEITNEAAAQEIYQGTLQAARQTAEDNIPPIAKVAAGPYVAFSVTPDLISMVEYGWGDNFTNAMEYTSYPEDSTDPS